MSYTKLFQSIVTSTIWTEDDQTRIVWVTMLALADKHGEVMGSIPGIARIAGVSLADAERAIQKLSSPDAYSRTPDHQGRRIESIDGGWALVNHAKYRAMASKEDQKERAAGRMRRMRERNTASQSVTVTPRDGTVTPNRDIADADADTKADAVGSSTPNNKPPLVSEAPEAHPRTPAKAFEPPTIDEVMVKAKEIGLNPAEADRFFYHFEANGWVTGRAKMKKWTAALHKWKSNSNNYGNNARNSASGNTRINPELAENTRKRLEWLAAGNSDDFLKDWPETNAVDKPVVAPKPV